MLEVQSNYKRKQFCVLCYCRLVIMKYNWKSRGRFITLRMKRKVLSNFKLAVAWCTRWVKQVAVRIREDQVSDLWHGGVFKVTCGTSQRPCRYHQISSLKYYRSLIRVYRGNLSCHYGQYILRKNYTMISNLNESFSIERSIE